MFVVSQAIELAKIYPLHALVLAVFISATFSKAIKVRGRNPKGLPLPPGPKGLPLLGCLFDVPNDKPWIVYDEWSKTYGDMIYFEVLGQPFLVLRSLQRTRDIFETRSSNYSDRMRMPMLIELMGWGFNMTMLPYGSWWRRHRRAFDEHFHQNVVSKYQPIQAHEVRAFLHRLLQSPDNFMHHIRHLLAATLMSVAYGISIKESEDPYISNIEEAFTGVAEAGIPGTFLVDLIPILKYVPTWFPGAGFKRKAAKWRELNIKVAELPFEYVEDQMKKGTAAPSMTTILVDRLPDKNDPIYTEERRIAQDATAVAYVGGANTTISSVQTFFLAIAIYPEVQRRAQEELDAVVGRDRLPDLSDRDSLPYINALMKESLRWNLVAPLAFPHMCSEDDEYDGYFIPKGTVVLGNSWSILHDPTVFSNPMEFRPERYLKDGQLDPDTRSPECAAFGYGRRLCPGRHMSYNFLYTIIASVLAVYDIKPPTDEHGDVIELKPEVTSGLVSYPVPFKCNIKPRDPLAEALIRDSVDMDH